MAPTPYNEKNDRKQDAKTTKGLTPKEKAQFKKADDKHRKPKNMADDTKMDEAIVRKIKAKRKK